MDLRDELKAAMAGDTGEGAAPDPVVETPAAPEAQEAEPVEPVAAAPEAPAGSPDRDEHGRFKPKTDTAQPEGAAQAAAQPPEATPETVKPAGQEPQSEAIRPPPSLPAAVKAKFAALDPDVRDAFVSLEGDVQKAKAEWGGKGQRLNRFEEILGPHVDRWRLSGLDEFSGIQALIAAQSMLDRNPIEGLVQVARSYGLTPAHLAQAFGLSQASAPNQGAEGQQAPTGAPDYLAALQQHLAPLATQVQTLTQQWTQSQQATQAAGIAEAQREIDAFAADPANMYFHNIAGTVGLYIERERQANPAKSMKDVLRDSYDAAVWADPTIRPLLIADQAKAAAAEQARAAAEATKAAEAAQRAKAQAARNAGGSVTGSPTPGAQAPTGAPRPLREELRANFQEAASGL